MAAFSDNVMEDYRAAFSNNVMEDYRKYTFAMVFMWYDNINRLFDTDGHNLQNNVLSLVETLKEREKSFRDHTDPLPVLFEFFVLSLACVGTTICLLNLTVLVKLFKNNIQQAASFVFAVMSFSNLIYLGSITAYTLVRGYNNPGIYLVTTTSLMFANWCLIPLLVIVIVQEYCPQQLCKWVSFRRLLASIVLIFFLSFVAALPGVVEIYCFTCDHCIELLTERKGSCTLYVSKIVDFQTKILPFIVHGVPFCAIVMLVIIGIRRYPSVGYHYQQNPLTTAKQSQPQLENLQVLLTAMWFLIYYFPTALLVIVVDTKDLLITHEEIRSARGLIMFALIFRILNATANFFCNVLASAHFRFVLFKIFCNNCVRLKTGEAVSEQFESSVNELD